MKPVVIFFSRSYQNSLFPFLSSDKYESIHITMTAGEQAILRQKGLKSEYCFELYKKLSEVPEKKLFN